MAKRKLSKKQLKKLHAKKTKGFSIWAHQTADERENKTESGTEPEF